jgi:F-type H+-transporting ATPase subunit b
MDFNINVIPDLQSMVITAITLLILYLIYKKFLYLPVSMYLQERRNYIQSEISEAKSLKEQAIMLKQDQEAYLNNVQRQGQEIIENARKFSEEMRANIIAEAKKEAREIILKAEMDIERQKKAALEEIKIQSIDMAILIASKIMEEQINLDKQEFLIDKFINEVGTSEWLS